MKSPSSKEIGEFQRNHGEKPTNLVVERLQRLAQRFVDASIANENLLRFDDSDAGIPAV